MKTLTWAAICAVAAGALAAQQQQAPPKTHLKVGDAAPDFTLPSTQRTSVTLSQLRGQPVVLAFFPAAFTGGCTKEMLAYQAGIGKFENARVFGISTDNVPSLAAFAEKLNVQFPLLSDFARREASRAYGVLMPDRGIANRATFVIDPEGRIAHIEEGSAAIDPTGAEMACRRVRSQASR